MTLDDYSAMNPVDEWHLYRTVRRVIDSGVVPGDVVAAVSAALPECSTGREMGTHDGDAKNFLDIYRKRVLVSEMTGHEIADARGLVSALDLYSGSCIHNLSFCIGGRLVLIVYENDRRRALGVIVSTTTAEAWW